MAPVQLYVYDLSNGAARQLSLQLTGRQIDGIWSIFAPRYLRPTENVKLGTRQL